MTISESGQIFTVCGVWIVFGKLGLIPFWYWVIRFFGGFDLQVCFLAITVFKIVPLVFFLEEGAGGLLFFGVVVNCLRVLGVFFIESFEVYLAFFSIFSLG